MTEEETLQILIITCIYSLLRKVWKGFSVRPKGNSVENISPTKINKDWLITYYHVLQLGFWKMCTGVRLCLHLSCFFHTGQFPKHNNNKIIKLHEMFIHNISSFSNLKETNIFSLIFSNKNHWKILMKLSIVFYITIKRH